MSEIGENVLIHLYIFIFNSVRGDIGNITINSFNLMTGEKGFFQWVPHYGTKA